MEPGTRALLFIFSNYLFMCLFLALLDHRCCLWAFSGYREQRMFSSCGVWASHSCSSFCCGAQALGTWASVVAARGLSSCDSRTLEYMGFHSWGAWVLLPHSTWDPPGPRFEHVSPALAGRFPATVPPGKSQCLS